LELTLTSVLLGTIIGLVLAVTGAGGASLAIPLLVLFLNITVIEAAPIALLTAFLASSVGAIQGLLLGTVRYKTALLIAMVGILIAPIGVKAASYTSNQVLSVILCSVLFYIGIQTWYTAKKLDVNSTTGPEPACALNPVTSRVFWTASCTKKLTITGGITGFLSGFLGVGGGFIIVPSLRKVSNFNHQTLTATTLAAVSMIALSGLLSHMHTHAVNWKIAIPLSISAASIMMLVSAMINHKIPEQLSKKSFAVVCITAAIYLAIKSFL
jgi:uncharacterized protein